jgi:hypothetical protein
MPNAVCVWQTWKLTTQEDRLSRQLERSHLERPRWRIENERHTGKMCCDGKAAAPQNRELATK